MIVDAIISALSIDHFVVIIVVAAAAAYMYYSNRKPRVFGAVVSREELLESKIESLEAAQDSLLQNYTQAQTAIRKLQGELNEAKQRIAVLEAQVIWYEQQRDTANQTVAAEMKSVRGKETLLVILGPDSELYVDLVALRKVAATKGFRLSRVYPATVTRIKESIDRRRREGSPVKYVHIAAHADRDGIIICDEEGTATIKLSPSGLSDILGDVEVLVIAGCSSSAIGDRVGVPYVVTMREDVTNDDARQFGEMFWEAIGDGLSPRDAFDRALDRVPNEVAEFAEFHS